ncbi:hypothetical protein L596_002619 [Steinernema carpocapsae]|uniref:Uncharacterized protein n=1 Tax=Steinernema carpocapsae TaxID=34508 RepID=A0A4V6I7S1_STECR|nr:hypothetical protein L596_002619 [Steinernema carpocapsae]
MFGSSDVNAAATDSWDRKRPPAPIRIPPWKRQQMTGVSIVELALFKNHARMVHDRLSVAASRLRIALRDET